MYHDYILVLILGYVLFILVNVIHHSRPISDSQFSHKVVFTIVSVAVK